MEKGSSSSSSSSAGLDSLNGLKFGKKIYFEGVGSGLHPKAGGVPPPAGALPPSPAKKGRTSAVQGGQPPRCLVDGCKVDLSNAKAYYSRHKVCSMHSKSPKVTVAGHEQRFCQQCSRFHQLPEFDQGKRSCRRRLAGHNERRRKPPPPLGSLLSPRYACFSPSFLEDRSSRAGGFVMDFSAYPALSGRDSWPNTSSDHQASITGKYHLPPQGSSQNPLPDLLPRPGASSDGCFNQVSDSCNALSLLSTQPWASRTRSTSLGASNFLGTPMIQQPSLTPAQFAFNQPDDALHEMPPHLGLGQAPFIGLAQPNDGHFHELDHSRGFDTSLHHMHWSL